MYQYTYDHIYVHTDLKMLVSYTSILAMRTFNDSLNAFTVSDITILAVLLTLTAVAVFTRNIRPRNMCFSAILSVVPTYSVDGMPNLPPGVVTYSQVLKEGKVITATTVPRSLLNQHNIKAGTWGIINVSKGKLQ